MSRALPIIALAFLAACSSGESVTSIPDTTTTPATAVPTTTARPLTATAAPTTFTSASTTTTASTISPPATTTVATTEAPPTAVSSPGTYSDPALVIHIAFESAIPDVSTAEVKATALNILNGPSGWAGSGFIFVADDTSELRVVLAEGPRVDAMCLPLETFGSVSCQNGSVVALNADRWRNGGRDWDSTVEAYRVYLVNHEVGHLIGLRHPKGRCPTPEAVSAVMEPQTNNLGHCKGNGLPMAWEIEWARNRPAVVGPAPDWDGPRPEWPTA